MRGDEAGSLSLLLPSPAAAAASVLKKKKQNKSHDTHSHSHTATLISSSIHPPTHPHTDTERRSLRHTTSYTPATQMRVSMLPMGGRGTARVQRDTEAAFHLSHPDTRTREPSAFFFFQHLVWRTSGRQTTVSPSRAVLQETGRRRRREEDRQEMKSSKRPYTRHLQRRSPLSLRSSDSRREEEVGREKETRQD